MAGANNIQWVRGDDPRLNSTYQYSVGVSGVTSGQVVRFNGTNYVPAQADSPTNAQAVGVAVGVSGGTGDIITSGIVKSVFGGLVAGSVYYLSQSSAGSITATKPSFGLIVVVGVAINSTDLLLAISIGEFNAQIVRGVPQSGCSNGNVVTYNGTNFVQAQANNWTNSQVSGIIQNVSGGTGDLYISGQCPTTGMTVSAGTTYYLSQTTAGAITSTKPNTGIRVTVGMGTTNSLFTINTNITYQVFHASYLCPIDYAQKSAGLEFWTLSAGSSAVTLNTGATSIIGTGAYAFTGTGTWYLSPFYAVDSLAGIGGFGGLATLAGTASCGLGFEFYDSTQTLITPNVSQTNTIINSASIGTTYVYGECTHRKEGTTALTLPVGSRYIRLKFVINTNPGTILLDGLQAFPMGAAALAQLAYNANFATIATYSNFATSANYT